MKEKKDEISYKKIESLEHNLCFYCGCDLFLEESIERIKENRTERVYCLYCFETKEKLIRGIT